MGTNEASTATRDLWPCPQCSSECEKGQTLQPDCQIQLPLPPRPSSLLGNPRQGPSPFWVPLSSSELWQSWYCLSRWGNGWLAEYQVSSKSSTMLVPCAVTMDDIFMWSIYIQAIGSDVSKKNYKNKEVRREFAHLSHPWILGGYRDGQWKLKCRQILSWLDGTS